MKGSTVSAYGCMRWCRSFVRRPMSMECRNAWAQEAASKIHDGDDQREIGDAQMHYVDMGISFVMLELQSMQDEPKFQRRVYKARKHYRNGSH